MADKIPDRIPDKIPVFPKERIKRMNILLQQLKHTRLN